MNTWEPEENLSEALVTKVQKKTKKIHTEVCEPLGKCSQLLHKIENDFEIKAFLKPVDWRKLGIPDYPIIITEPMDLGTIKYKLEDGL